ncbi:MULTISPECIES: serine/threonine-protein kinase [unclassified Agrococcus]|uniref:serine/threonine-protein kinase n=1 Tax=unclassified Agrococcus TaxID=2615065 RepID=UPI00361F42E7
MDVEHHSSGLAPGSLLAGRYRVGPLLGAGGMASVHRATDEVLRRDVAIKVLESPRDDDASRRRGHAEVELLATLSHRSLVTMYDVATVRLGGEMHTIIVMELIDGPTLAQRRARGALCDLDLARLAIDMGEALAVVHARGVVHRDVKPSNILLAPSPLSRREFDARLADFGIATLDGGARLTATGAVLGTAAYLSPEQALGGRVTPAADVYSLGLVLLEAITGAREFPGPALEALSARVLRDPVVPDAIHPQWAALLRAMTSREPEDRPSAEEVVEIVAELEAARSPILVEQPASTDATRVLPAGAAVAAAASSAARTTRASRPPAAASHRRRPRRAVVVGLVGGLAAAAVAIVAVALQPALGDVAPSAPAEVAESSPPAAPSPSAPVAAPEPTAVPVETAPVQPAPAPVEPGVADGGAGTDASTVAVTDAGDAGTSGSGNGDGAGNGNGPGGSSGSNPGNGSGGNSGSNSGNGNGNGNGNG